MKRVYEVICDVWHLYRDHRDPDETWSEVIDAADKILEKYDGTPVYQLACELTYAIINYLEHENIVI